MRNLSYAESLLNVFGDSFSSFRNSVSSEFSGEDELDSRLNLSGWKSSSLVESDEFGSFSGDSVEGIVDEGVHDVHGLLWDSDVGVHLLEDFVDVDGEGLDSSSSGFLVSSGFFGLGWFLSHFDVLNSVLLKAQSNHTWNIINPPLFLINFDWLNKSAKKKYGFDC